MSLGSIVYWVTFYLLMVICHCGREVGIAQKYTRTFNLKGLRFFEENSFFPWRWFNQKTNGTIWKCFSRAFQWYGHVIRFWQSLNLFGQFLCPAHPWWQKSPSVLKELKLDYLAIQWKVIKEHFLVPSALWLKFIILLPLFLTTWAVGP
jgi:hypothetical protein